MCISTILHTVFQSCKTDHQEFYLNKTLLLFTFELTVLRTNEIHDILVNSVYL